MALFPPEFIAGVLFAFVQIRLRSIVSIASLLTNGLSFFLPPEDELINRLNGVTAATRDKTGRVKTPATMQPLSVEQKMSSFFINVAKTEHGIFQHTIFIELYETMVILATSTLGACVFSDALAYYTDSSATDAKTEISIYGLMSVLMVCIWFPLQVKFAQGLDTYEAKLGLGVGTLGCIFSLYAIFSPKQLFDFDVEGAIAIAGARVEIVLRAIGFEDGDMENIALAATLAKITTFFHIALLCGIFTTTSFLPAFRFARIYGELVKDKSTSVVKKLLLHANMVLPLLAAVCWIKPLSTDALVPSFLVRCSPHKLTRDCFAKAEDEAAFASRGIALTESQWHTLRVYIVWLTVLVRMASFHAHLQYFLVEPKEAIVQLVRRPGPVDGELLKNKIRLQFNYVPIIAIQYLAPVGVITACLVLLARQTSTSLGVYDAFACLLAKTGLIQERSLAWFTAAEVLPTASPPDIGGFRLGDEISGPVFTQFVKGMTTFSVVTPEAYASLLGFLLWWFTFGWFIMTVAGLVYWKNVPHGLTSSLGLQTTSAAAAANMRRNRETPKLLKNQLKSLKMKKH